MVNLVKTKIRILILATTCCLLLASCGFGSSSQTTTTTTSTTTTTTTLPAISSIFSSNVPGLSVGDCFDEGSVARQVDCVELHDGQVIATNISLDSELSGTTSAALWNADAEDKCATEYKDFVGHEYSRVKGRFNISILITDAYSTTVSCTVVNADGEKWAGSAKNFVGSYEGISVGDCLMFPTEVNDAQVISCSQPHEGEMFVEERSIGVTSKTALYPTRSEWRDISFRICEKPFYTYTGVAEDNEDVTYSYTYPLEEDWAIIKGRTISCIASSYTGELISYSVRRSVG